MDKFEALGRAIGEEFATKQSQIDYLEGKLKEMKENNIRLAEMLHAMADILEGRVN